jgi:hypothetical protein
MLRGGTPAQQENQHASHPGQSHRAHGSIG